MKNYPIENADKILDMMRELYHEKSIAFSPIWEAWYTARKELNELGYAMDKLDEAKKTGVVNSKTLKTIEKYFPKEN